MTEGKLPNYYDVSIEAWQWTPKPGMTVGDSRHFTAQAVEAADPQTAVRLTLNQQWGTCDIDEGDSGEGWVVHRMDDEEGPWLELDVDDYGNCATAVPYERRLRLAGYQPMGFVE